jgi:hypothetical protein
VQNINKLFLTQFSGIQYELDFLTIFIYALLCLGVVTIIYLSSMYTTKTL